MLRSEPTLSHDKEYDEISCQLEGISGVVTLGFRDGYFYLGLGENSASVRYGSFDPSVQYTLATREGDIAILRLLVALLIPLCSMGGVLNKDCWLGLIRMRKAMIMLSIPLPEWLCVSLFFRAGTYIVQSTGSNVSPRQMQDVKLSPAQRAEVASKVAEHSPDAEWIDREDTQDEDGLCLLEIWFYDGHIGEVNYNSSLAKSRIERSELLQTLVLHLS